MAGAARGPMRDFQFEGGAGVRKKVISAVPLEAYLVKYHDADGKQQVRVALTVPGTDIGLVGQHQISGTQVFAPMSKWFIGQLKEKVGPKDGVESV